MNEKNSEDIYSREYKKILTFIQESDDITEISKMRIHESMEKLNMTEIMRAIISLVVWNSVAGIVSFGVNTGMGGYALAKGALDLKLLLPALSIGTINFIGKYIFLRQRFAHMISRTGALKAATPYFGSVMLIQDLLRGHPELKKALTIYLTTGPKQFFKKIGDFFRAPEPEYGRLYALSR